MFKAESFNMEFSCGLFYCFFGGFCWKPQGFFEFAFCLHSISLLTWNPEYPEPTPAAPPLELSILTEVYRFELKYRQLSF